MIGKSNRYKRREVQHDIAALHRCAHTILIADISRENIK